MLARQHRLLLEPSHGPGHIHCQLGPRAAFEACWALVHDPERAFGVVGQVQRADDGHPYLRVHAMTDIQLGRGDLSRQPSSLTCRGRHGVRQPTVAGGRSLVSGASRDQRCQPDPQRRPPPGHRCAPSPAIHAAQLVAMVGLAKPAGYPAPTRFCSPAEHHGGDRPPHRAGQPCGPNWRTTPRRPAPLGTCLIFPGPHKYLAGMGCKARCAVDSSTINKRRRRRRPPGNAVRRVEKSGDWTPGCLHGMSQARGARSIHHTGALNTPEKIVNRVL